MESYLLNKYYKEQYATRDIAILLGVSNNCVNRWIKEKLKLVLRNQKVPSEKARGKQAQRIYERKLTQYVTPTKQEKYIKDVFVRKYYNVRTNYPIEVEDKLYYLDVVIIDKKIGIEIDGEEHSEKRMIVNDIKRTQDIKTLGWRIFRIKNKTINKRLNI